MVESKHVERALDMGREALRNVTSNVERPLRLLLLASFVLPVVVFVLGAWISYQYRVGEVDDDLDRTLGHVYEHATKVFETFDLTANYVDELIDGSPNEDVDTAEGYYHEKFKSLVESLPQIRDIWLIDRNGHPVVSGTRFPVPRDLDFSNRPFFKAQKSSDSTGSYLGEVMSSPWLNGRKLFVLSRRRILRGSDGFFGVTAVAIAPEYFTDYYSRLPRAKDDFVALLRDDGAILAFYPGGAGPASKLPSGSKLRAAMRNSSYGMLTMPSFLGGGDQYTGFRKLPGHGVYVMVAIPASAVVHDWIERISYRLVFVVPATVALILLAWIALHRARREALAYSQLREEATRRETTEQALRQAQKMEAIGRLTGGIAHDFNNLLTTIIGNLDLAGMRLKDAGERVTRPLSAAKDSSRRAASLVQRLLAFSRQHPQEIGFVDVGRLIHDMSELLHGTIGEIVTIETVLAHDLWSVSADRNQLENAILNLAVNARDAMPEGGRLRIEATNSRIQADGADIEGERIARGEYVLISMSDTGAGMGKEVLEQAFEPFFTTKPKGVGTGLGLSMVYGFVKQSGGHIRITSEVGHGTTVMIYLPRALPPAQTVERSSRRRTGTETSLATANGETILLVEDDESVNRFGCEALRELGYRVLSATTAAGAMKLLAENPDVSLLFTDVVLPGGTNGRGLAEAASKAHPDIKVLFATGYARDAIVHKGRIEPGLNVLMKPYSYQTVARRVREILDRPPIGPVAASSSAPPSMQ